MGKEPFHSLEKKEEYLEKKLNELKRTRTEVNRQERILLEEWKTLIKEGRDKRRLKNFNPQENGQDLNNWFSTRPR